MKQRERERHEERDRERAREYVVLTCSAVFSRFSISKLLVRDVGLATPSPDMPPPPATTVSCDMPGSTNEGAGELSASGEYRSLPVPSTQEEREREEGV